MRFKHIFQKAIRQRSTFSRFTYPYFVVIDYERQPLEMELSSVLFHVTVEGWTYHKVEVAREKSEQSPLRNDEEHSELEVSWHEFRGFQCEYPLL